MTKYSSKVERHVVAFYNSLSEKDRRRYAAVQAEQLGHGGTQYIAELLGCDPDTIRRGSRDIEQLPTDDAEGRVRVRGGASQS